MIQVPDGQTSTGDRRLHVKNLARDFEALPLLTDETAKKAPVKPPPQAKNEGIRKLTVRRLIYQLA